MIDADLKLQLSGCIIRLRQRGPYFAVLVSYLIPVQVPDDSEIQTAATDATHLFINKKWFLGLPLKQRDGLLLHEVLHAALGHCWRCGSRLPDLWNVAADYVVNLIVRAAGYELPAGGLYDEQFKNRSVEEAYAMLLKDVQEILSSGNIPHDIKQGSGKTPDQLAKDWAQAKSNAAAVAKLQGTGHSDEELLAKHEESQVDWRRFLWNELSFTPADYTGYDRRFIADEIFVEGLEPEETLLDIGICADTSGSTMHVIGKFVAEVRQISSMYPNVKIDRYWQDTTLIGPISDVDVERPIGGGGTDFRPYFEEAEKQKYKLSIFLTDGYGTFPEKKPDHRVIFVVCAGGLAADKFPFGEVIKILE